MATGALPPETQYAKAPDGMYIAYQVVGEGPPDILYYPNSGCIEVIWEEPSYRRALERLAGMGRLILFDGRGVGASDPFPMNAIPTIEHWGSEDVPVVLDAVGADAVNLICFGLAGYIAMFFAATHPARTERVVLIDTTARFTRSDDYPIGGERAAIQAVFEATVELWGTGQTARLVVPSRADDEAFRRWYARFERESMSQGMARALVPLVSDFDVRATLPAIHAPTLVLHKEEGVFDVFPLAGGRYIAEHIPGARLITYPGHDWFPFGDSADGVLDHIEEFITGTRPAPAPDRTLATVLFTDIVDSTGRAAHLGDKKWARLLDRHDEIISGELARWRGQRVNPTGDGVLATFDGPARAVRCAHAIVAATGSLGIDVRAGVHTGEVELRGEDIAGIAVHIGQRVSGLAEPGEILVSRTVVDLVAGSGIEFKDRGEHELKGIPGLWRVFAVENCPAQ